MKKLNFYGYFFYTLYCFQTKSESERIKKWKAIAMMGVLKIWFVSSIAFILISLFGIDIMGSNPFKSILFYIVMIIVLIVPYLLLERNEKWKYYVDTYNKLPKSRQNSYRLFTWLFIFMIIILLVLSIYLMSINSPLNK